MSSLIGREDQVRIGQSLDVVLGSSGGSGQDAGDTKTLQKKESELSRCSEVIIGILFFSAVVI